MVLQVYLWPIGNLVWDSADIDGFLFLNQFVGYFPLKKGEKS